MTPTLMPPPETAARPIAGERCDRCSAAAKVRIVLADDAGDLVFCGHHANKFAEQLAKIAVDFIVDPESEFTWRGSDLMSKN